MRTARTLPPDFSPTPPEALDPSGLFYFLRDLAAYRRQEGEWEQSEEDQFFLAMGLTFMRLSALIDNTSEWGGRASVEDNLFDRYTMFTSRYPTGFEVRCRWTDAKSSRDRSDALSCWECLVEEVPNDPDKLRRTACLFNVWLPSSYEGNGSYELASLTKTTLGHIAFA